jgi:zinc transporter
MRTFALIDGKASEVAAGHALPEGRAEMVWYHLDGRDEQARVWLQAQEDIPELARSALLASETRPRSEAMGEGVLVNLRGLGEIREGDSDRLVSVRFWAQSCRCISVGLRESSAIPPTVEAFLDGRIRDPGDLLASFADVITDQLDPDVAKLGDSLDDFEVKLEAQSVWKLRRDVSMLRSSAIAYRRFVGPQRQALERLALARVDWFDEADRAHLSEAADRFARMAEELEAIRERAAVVHDELTDLHAEQMDSRALAISIYALVFLPLTFITGLLGMNVPIPYQEHPNTFWVVLGVCLLISFGGLGWFLRRRWLRRDSLSA